jgi:hypothetical protein
MATWIGIGTTDPGDDIKVGSHKVGIGTTSPSKPLHLRGDMLQETSTGWSSGGVTQLSMGDTSTYLQNNYGGSFVISSNNKMRIETTSGTAGCNYISIMPGASGSGRVGINTTSPANMLSVAGGADISGTVGIGTTSPGEKLEVNGKIKVAAGNYSLTLEENDIKFNRNGGPSYIRNDAGMNSLIEFSCNSTIVLALQWYSPHVVVNGNFKATGSMEAGGQTFVDASGYLTVKTSTAQMAPPNTIFVDSTSYKLCFQDRDGNSHDLY